MRLRQEQKGFIFLLLILLIIGSVSLVLYFLLEEDPVGEILEQEQVIKLLIVMEDEGEVLFTDVFLYYPLSHVGAMISIPGNTGSIYSSIGRVDRIDRIYSEKGIQVYRSEIEKLIGSSIPFYIVIGLKDLQLITDRLGGMRVLVPSPVDALSPEGKRWLLPSGSILLDGDKLAVYLEYFIEDETDSSAAERRQNVVIALLSALNRNASVIFEKKNFKFYEKKFTSNVNANGLRDLLREISKVDAERIVPQTVTGMRRLVDGNELLFPFYDGQLIKDVVMQTVNSLVSETMTLSGRVYVLEIKNGTTVQGLAHNTAALFRSAGYDILRTLNAASNDIEKTEIIDHIGNAEAAKSLGNFIRCNNIREEDIQLSGDVSDENRNVDFTIILGGDFDGRYVH
ncbi:LCP family protein [Treponema parvum]|uniref:LCP family protein n=1 Tax=Treponema parvum TaxID=138851 RepID=A0A975IC39_9SPIR|nr:LCP family protein [Treponema parvum]QTQ11490.1 LCP family protein [Treponema parvum]